MAFADQCSSSEKWCLIYSGLEFAFALITFWKSLNNKSKVPVGKSRKSFGNGSASVKAQSLTTRGKFKIGNLWTLLKIFLISIIKKFPKTLFNVRAVLKHLLRILRLVLVIGLFLRHSIWRLVSRTILFVFRHSLYFQPSATEHCLFSFKLLVHV